MLNKIDRIAKSKLLPSWPRSRRSRRTPRSSGEREDAAAELSTVLNLIVEKLPEGPSLYPTTTSRRKRSALVQELVREQIFSRRATRCRTDRRGPRGVHEKPQQKLTVVKATILVDRENHKPIVLGAKGERIKAIGTTARQEIEAMLGTKVFLELFVRVEPGWAKDARRLKELGL